MENKKYFKQMLNLQDKFNCKVHPEWAEQEFDFVNAIMLEGAEAIDSLHWKWWKAGEDNLPNFKVEIIDIWHFHMSYMMIQYSNAAILSLFQELWNHEASNGLDRIQRTQLYIKEILCAKWSLPEDKHTLEFQTKALNTATVILFDMMKDVGIESVEELCNEYIVKNVLNGFRQDNGYKEGTYIKDWNGEEDNVVAFRLIKDVIEGQKTFSEDEVIPEVSVDLYQMLDGYYHVRVLKESL